MRVLVFRNQEVDESDDAHTCEKRQKDQRLSVLQRPDRSDLSLSLREKLRQRDEYHHARAHSQCSGQEITAEFLLEEHERTSDACSGTGDQRQQ